MTAGPFRTPREQVAAVLAVVDRDPAAVANRAALRRVWSQRVPTLRLVSARPLSPFRTKVTFVDFAARRGDTSGGAA